MHEQNERYATIMNCDMESRTISSTLRKYFFFKVQQKEEAFILVKEIKVFMLTKELLVLKQEQ